MHPGPPRRKRCARRVDHRYRRNHSGLPCAVVYGLLRALLGEPGFLATVALQASRVPARLSSTRIPQDLTPASGRQDHTTSPSATVSTKAELGKCCATSAESFSETCLAPLVLRAVQSLTENRPAIP